jgi:hypothetical protein
MIEAVFELLLGHMLYRAQSTEVSLDILSIHDRHGEHPAEAGYRHHSLHDLGILLAVYDQFFLDCVSCQDFQPYLCCT